MPFDAAIGDWNDTHHPSESTCRHLEHVRRSHRRIRHERAGARETPFHNTRRPQRGHPEGASHHRRRPLPRSHARHAARPEERGSHAVWRPNLRLTVVCRRAGLRHRNRRGAVAVRPESAGAFVCLVTRRRHASLFNEGRRRVLPPHLRAREKPRSQGEPQDRQTHRVELAPHVAPGRERRGAGTS